MEIPEGLSGFYTTPEGVVYRKSYAEAVRTGVAPASPVQIVNDTNPEMFRAMYSAMMADETGELAQAGFGASKVEAEAKTILPEPGLLAGRHPNKVSFPEELKDKVRADGNLGMTEAEEAVRVRQLNQSLTRIDGLKPHNESMTVRTLPDGRIRFTNRYTFLDRGYLTAKAAMEAARVGLRAYRLSEDSLTPIARFGDEWVEVSEDVAEANRALASTPEGRVALGEQPTEYGVALKLDYRMGPDDLTAIASDLESLTGITSGALGRSVNRAGNWGLQGQGTVMQHAVDPAATIHPQIVGAASVSVDRAPGIEKALREGFEEFSKGYKGLKKDRRQAIDDYIHEANRDGLALDEVALRNQFDENEIGLLKKWRNANDIVWSVANDDMARTLQARGVKVLIHEASDTKLMGNPMKRGAEGIRDSAYDPVAKTSRNMTKEELDELYENGGEIFELTTPIDIGDGLYVNKYIVYNRSGSSYTREIYDGETVLAYRDGYYPVMYDANYFVEQRIKGADGKEFTKVVAAARTQKDVNEFLETVARERGLDDANELTRSKEFSFREDRNKNRSGDQIFEEGSWDVAAGSGLSMQRFRGERLQSVGDDVHKIDKAHLKDPLDAVANQVRSLSQRTAMRNFIDMAKRRWMLTYGKHLDLPKNKAKQDMYPTHPDQIKPIQGMDETLASDAVTLYNYLYALENGYINLLDSGYKSAMSSFARGLGELGLSGAEKAAWVAQGFTPMQAGRILAFKLFLAANPLRQAIVQRGQITMLAGRYDPKYIMGQMQVDWWGVNKARFNKEKGLPVDPKYKAMLKDLEDSGVIEAVDAHTLVRENLLRLADTTVMQKAATVIDWPFKMGQKIGFDLAEQDVLITAWLAARDKAIRAGKDISSRRVKDELLAEARSFTLQMNRAGEMAYSQNTLALMAQFLSFQHKALLQPFTNRNLTTKQRIILGSYSLGMFGFNASMFYWATDAIFGEEPSPTKDLARNGMMDYTFNKAAEMIFGGESRIDWGDLAPTEGATFGNMFVGLLEGNLLQAIADAPSNAPAASLFFGANPRMTDAFRTAGMLFKPLNYEEEELKVKPTDVATGFLNLASGWSNGTKAQYALKTRQKMSSSGRISVSDLSAFEASMVAFGFQTKTENGFRELNELRFKGYQVPSNEIEDWYRQLKRHLSRRYERVTDKDMASAILREAWTVFGEDRPRVQSVIVDLIAKDAKAGDHRFVLGLMSNMGISSPSEVWRMINKLPAGNERDSLVEMMKQLENITDGN
jgi:hypothetical protein